MTLQGLLQLMHEIAENSGGHVCLGIQVSPDGSGRTTPGTADDGLPSFSCKYGPKHVSWSNPCDGSSILGDVLRFKQEAIRKASETRQLILIGGEECNPAW